MFDLSELNEKMENARLPKMHLSKTIATFLFKVPSTDHSGTLQILGARDF